MELWYIPYHGSCRSYIINRRCRTPKAQNRSCTRRRRGGGAASAKTTKRLGCPASSPADGQQYPWLPRPRAAGTSPAPTIWRTLHEQWQGLLSTQQLPASSLHGATALLSPRRAFDLSLRKIAKGFLAFRSPLRDTVSALARPPPVVFRAWV